MDERAIFRLALFSLLAAMLVIRTAFSLRIRKQGERTMPDRQAIRNEGVVLFTMRVLLFFVLIAIIVLYAIDFPIIKALEFSLPAWLRWTGLGVGCISIALLTWSERELGRQFSPQLQIRTDHLLVTGGPYAFIRHPIYLAIYGYSLGLALVSANWIFIGFFLLSLVGLGVRVPKEEQMMIEQFGDEYRAYMERTGRFGPRL